MFDARHIWRFNAKTVTNGSISNVLVFSHFPTVMTNGHALLVCETEIFIQPFSFPFPLIVDSFPLDSTIIIILVPCILS